MTRSAECVCDVQDRLSGTDAKRYAESHLILQAPPAWIGETGREIYAPDVWAEWTCPVTGWQWNGSLSRLLRRPRTSRADYLSHAVVAERAVAVVRSHRDIHRFFRHDDAAWKEATVRGWMARE